ncbi:RNA polymerase sigma factor [Paraliomyxa miuraensis]|uniref:RNA polymerase sigma factor n=1 Tax=Paraliomyxa miuraensis TaxID=376150 RepID=UPI00224E4758|nr:hypothetical protein [Paraliomyxa miuraensis]MCX4239490.1 hypothetical protein [Paraliomyxa miuraensis]
MADDFDPLSRSDTLHDQMEEALGSLTNRDKLQLLCYARVLARGLDCDAHDLLQEAQVRALSGSWQWNGSTFKKDLMRIMWSVASTWRDKQRARTDREARFVAENPSAPYLLDQSPNQLERIEKLREHLLEKRDEDCVLFLDAVLEGKTYQEAREDLGIDAGKPFNTLTRRLRRQIERL